MQQSNLTVRYHNMGNWPAESREPKAKLLLIQISEQIIFRETALQALRSALSVMDKKYWQYCVERIKATEAGRTIKSEAMITLINQLFEAQKHVAVLIAHVRSLAIELIEKVRQLRQIHAKNMKAASVVSIYWMNQNYLLKIKSDMEFLNSSPTMRLWLGFTARELVIPPHTSASAMAGAAANNVHTINPHDPKAHWWKTHKQVYFEWFKKHEAYIHASWKSGKSKVIFKSDRKFLTADSVDGGGHSHRSPQRPHAVAGISSGTGSVMTGTVTGQHTPARTPGMTPEVSRPQTPQSNADSRNVSGSKPGSRPTEEDAGMVVVEVRQPTPFGETSNVPTPRVESPRVIQEDGASTPLQVDVQDTMSPEIMNPDSRPLTPLTPDSPETRSPMAHGFSTKSRPVDSLYAASFNVSSESADGEGLQIGFGESFDALEFVDRSSSEADFATGPDVFPENPSERLLGPSMFDESIGIAMPGTLSTVDETTAGPNTTTVTTVAGLLPPTGAGPTHLHTGGDAMHSTSSESRNGVMNGAPSAAVSGAVSGAASGVASGAVSGAETPVPNKNAPVSNTSRGALTAENSLSTVANEIPEWQQLAEYARHSWGVMQVVEDVNDCNNAFQDYKHGFHDRLHGINDSRTGLNDHKHAPNVDYVHGFYDAKHGFDDAVVGFQESTFHNANKESISVYEQGKKVAPLFWKTVDHNPLVVEAATGFEECFPTIYMVAPMPPDLLSRAEKCAHLLRKEYETEQEIRQQRLKCDAHKASITSMVTAEALESMASDSFVLQRSIEDGAMLKLRQQGTTELLTGISINHLSNSLSLDAGSLQSLILPSHSQFTAPAQPSAPSVSHVNNRRKGGIVGEEDGENVFLTNSYEEGGMVIGGLEQSDDKLPEQSVLYPQMHTFGSYVDTKDFHFFRVEDSSKLRQRIEEKIADGRKAVEYKPGEIFPVLRADRVGLREPSHDTVKWRSIHAITMQRVVRGFMGRRFARKMRISQAFNRSAQKVRTLVIGFMWRYRQREKYWESRFEAFLMRKLAVKKFRASMTLAAFFRKIVRARRQMREDDERIRLLKEAHATGDENFMRRLSMHAATAVTPVSRNIRRKYGQKLTDDSETKSKPYAASPKIAASPKLSADKQPGEVQNSQTSTASHSTAHSSQGLTGESPSPERVTSKQGGRHVTINAVSPMARPASTAKPTTPGISSAPSSAPPTPALAGSTTDAIGTGSTATTPGMYSSRILTPSERLRSIEAPGPYEESVRREQLKNGALSLVARVNRGKIQCDTRYTSRLIPTQTVPNLASSNAKMKKFSSKEYAFMNMPSQPPPQSLIKSSSDVFVGPIPKRVSSRGSASTSQLPTIDSLDLPPSPVQSAAPSPDGTPSPSKRHATSNSVDFSQMRSMSTQFGQSPGSDQKRRSSLGDGNQGTPPGSADKKSRSQSINPSTSSSASVSASFSIPEGSSARMTSMSLTSSFAAPSSKQALFPGPPLHTPSFNMPLSVLHSAGSNVIGGSAAPYMMAKSSHANAHMNAHMTMGSFSDSGKFDAGMSHSRSIMTGSNMSSGSGSTKAPVGNLRSASTDVVSNLGSSVHIGEVKLTPGSAGHGGVLLRYNSTGLTLRSKKQQEAHDKAEAERLKLRNTLLKYM